MGKRMYIMKNVGEDVCDVTRLRRDQKPHWLHVHFVHLHALELRIIILYNIQYMFLVIEGGCACVCVTSE